MQQNQTVRDLFKVLEISRSLAVAVELDDLLRLIIQRAMELLQAERATVFLYDAATDEVISRVAAGAESIRVPANRGIVGRTIRENTTIRVGDAYADPSFCREVDQATGFRTRNILSLPLRDYEQKVIGVLQVLNDHKGPFCNDDVTLGETLAAQAGVALQRARLIEHYVEKQRMERAMKIARDIQQGLLPQKSPQISGFDVAGFCLPEIGRAHV